MPFPVDVMANNTKQILLPQCECLWEESYKENNKDTKYTANKHTHALKLLQLNPPSLMDVLSNHHHNSLCVATAKEQEGNTHLNNVKQLKPHL